MWDFIGLLDLEDQADLLEVEVVQLRLCTNTNADCSVFWANSDSNSMPLTEEISPTFNHSQAAICQGEPHSPESAAVWLRPPDGLMTVVNEPPD